MNTTLDGIFPFFEANKLWLEPFLDGSIEQYPALCAKPGSKVEVHANVVKYKNIKAQFEESALMRIQQSIVTEMRNGPLAEDDKVEMVTMAIDFFAFLYSLQHVDLQKGVVFQLSQ